MITLLVFNRSQFLTHVLWFVQETNMSEILKSAPIIEQTATQLKEKVEALRKSGITPFMKVVLVGNNPASVSYIKNKQKLCEKVGAKFELVHLEESVSESDFLKEIDEINSNDLVHGAIIQLPLPRHLENLDVARLIDADKDIDGFHPENIYNVMVGKDGLLPCTPTGVMKILDHYRVKLEGKHVCVIGRSMIVGKPVSMLLQNRNATVTMCHSRTQNLEEITKQSDIIVTAIGKPNFLSKKHLNETGKQVLIDVGINRKDGKLCGDIDFEGTKNLVAAITPVPGGVGPMTVLSLIENLIRAAKG
jgi:methylenetetrahydrofolate dehydrogenase (NADP+)/methenyltetrahydrofolate cyclohydrolase